MRVQIVGWIGVVALGAGCAGQSSTSEEVIVGKPNEAGVVAYRVTSTPGQLSIVGEDAAGNTVGHVEVMDGRYTMSEGFAEGRTGDQLDVDGRRIYVDVTGTPKWRHEAEGYHSLRLRLPDVERYHRFDAFLLDRRLTEVLVRRGITFSARQFRPRTTDGEVEYDAYPDWCTDAYSGQFTSALSTYNLCNVNNNPRNQEYTATIGTWFAEKFLDELCVCNKPTGQNGCDCTGGSCVVADAHMFFETKQCCGSPNCQTSSCGAAGTSGCAKCGAEVDTGYTWANRPSYLGLGIGQTSNTCYAGGADCGYCGWGTDKLCHNY